MKAIMSDLKEVWQSMMLGFFAMLPGIFFVGFFQLVSHLVGIDYENNMIPIVLFGGACGGVWLCKKFILITIEKMPDQTSKWEVYGLIKNGKK